MNCQVNRECGREATTKFRVQRNGEGLYRRKVCDYHAELWRGSKYAKQVDRTREA